MTGQTFILCPGQGAQVVGMGRRLVDTSPAARQVFESANAILGWDLTALCFDGPDQRLNQTDISQPAIYVTSIASYRAAEAAGAIDPSQIGGYAGLSLGEYTALHLAGVFGFEQGLRLVAVRGRCMQEAAQASPSGMVALIGADHDTAAKVCRDAAGADVLVPANYNAPGQVVISGSIAACQRAVAVAEAAGLRATSLKVAGAFHSPLMQPAARRMSVELDAVEFRSPAAPVYSNVTGDVHASDAASIRHLLVEQIVSPVRWEQTMAKLAADDGAQFTELAPGKTLAGLARRVNRRLVVRSLDTADATSRAANV